MEPTAGRSALTSATATMHRGTLFIWLFLGLSPGVAVLLPLESVRRVLREPQRRWRIIAVSAAALGLWALATRVMFEVAFFAAWGLAHMRPFPDDMFPEGWPIYAWLAAYTIFGAAPRAAIRRFPRKLP